MKDSEASDCITIHKANLRTPTTIKLSSRLTSKTFTILKPSTQAPLVTVSLEPGLTIEGPELTLTSDNSSVTLSLPSAYDRDFLTLLL